MFADINQGYGTYGRSLRKKLKSVVSAPVKVVKAAVKPLARITTGIVKSVVKPVVKTVLNPLSNPIKSLAAIALLPLSAGIPLLAKSFTDLKKMKRQSIGADPQSGQEIAQYTDENGNIITEQQYNQLMTQYASEEQRLSALQQTGGTAGSTVDKLIRRSRLKQVRVIGWNPNTGQAEIGTKDESGNIKNAEGIYLNVQQPMTPTQAQQATYAPQQQYYPAPTQQQQEYYNQEQRQPEQPYYSEKIIPVEEGSAMQDDFRQEQTEDNYRLPEGDFGGLGFDDDTVLLLKEAETNVQAALDAGNKYVSSIQGKATNTVGAIIPDSKTDTTVPKWMWLVLGGALLVAVTSSPKKKSRKR